MSDLVNGVRLQLGPDIVLPDGRTLIKAFENCSLTSYLDSAGKWTIGWGHKSPDISAGLTWTQLQCDQTFENDFSIRLGDLIPLLRNCGGLKAGHLAAIQSLAFNVGVPAFATSHMLVCIKNGDWIGAAHEFPRWDHVGTGENAGLLHRRFAEGLVFISAR